MSNELRNFSDYERTGNKSIDLVAQAVGWAKKMQRPLKSVTLSRQAYALFWAGTEILMQKFLPPEHKLTFQKIDILQGSMLQWETMTLQFWDNSEKIQPITVN